MRDRMERSPQLATPDRSLVTAGRGVGFDGRGA
jgi:hypothetical protein